VAGGDDKGVGGGAVRRQLRSRLAPTCGKCVQRDYVRLSRQDDGYTVCIQVRELVFMLMFLVAAHVCPQPLLRVKICRSCVVMIAKLDRAKDKGSKPI
jgi:hypothetical protein